MDSFEINKIFGAICATALFILVLTIITDLLYSEPELKQQAYIVNVPDMDVPTSDETVEVVEIDVMELLVMASLENGQKVAKKCYLIDGMKLICIILADAASKIMLF